MAIGNMCKKLVKIRLIAPDICVQTDTHADRETQSSQYYADLPVAKYSKTRLSG